MRRRDILKAGAALPALSHLPLHAQAGSEWKPTVFTAGQAETVAALAEAIIPRTDTPGAREAQVHRYIDLLLRDGPARERERFLAGLRWFEDYVFKNFGKAFPQLTAEEQTRALTPLAEAKLTAGAEPGQQFFRTVKALTSRIYYNTAIGFRELNKGGVPKTWACPHPEKYAGGG